VNEELYEWGARMVCRKLNWKKVGYHNVPFTKGDHGKKKGRREKIIYGYGGKGQNVRQGKG